MAMVNELQNKGQAMPHHEGAENQTPVLVMRPPSTAWRQLADDVADAMLESMRKAIQSHYGCVSTDLIESEIAIREGGPTIQAIADSVQAGAQKSSCSDLAEELALIAESCVFTPWATRAILHAIQHGAAASNGRVTLAILRQSLSQIEGSATGERHRGEFGDCNG